MEITFITTGGTIDKDYPKKLEGYAFEISDPAIVRILERVNPSFKYRMNLLLTKDSLEITEEDRELILEICKTTPDNKIIITHGTDTMLETAQKLSEVQNKVIILVGSMRPERFADSDADFNLGCAIGAINVLEKGIYIAMHGRVYAWDKCKRDPETGQFIEV